ncbi:MAG: virulence protein RhuM/Fic/DOC family protein [Spirochaetales bacterium]|nr:virulence protein RhuM/Fic/DOC family protein [Spirochaetales bacterium]
MAENKIEIYKSPDKETQIEVRFDHDSVWLTQPQIVSLFHSSKANISEHIRNIFKTGELYEDSTVRNFRTVQKEGKRKVARDRPHYNLDVIISVGYRVNSKRGTQFRQWATRRLREYLVEGYAINKKRLAERDLQVSHLKTGITILRRAVAERPAGPSDAAGLAEMLERFSSGLALLDDYDHESLDTTGKTKRKAVLVKADEYRNLIASMRGHFSSGLFGREKDSSFDSSVSQIFQAFDGKDAYPTLEEKAAMLLYLIVKNHSFVDGNKRIAAACFLYFLGKNNLLYDKKGTPSIHNDALAALTLFIAVSKPSEMETVKQVIISVLNRKKST